MKKELQELIKRYEADPENYVLAKYLNRCMQAWDHVSEEAARLMHKEKMQQKQRLPTVQDVENHSPGKFKNTTKEIQKKYGV